MNSVYWTMNKQWTLFLDRDGVINKRLMNDYVKSPEAFEFLPGVLEALAQLNSQFYKIVVVTNQQGVGKGLYSLDDLSKIHQHMLLTVEKHGGRIDKVYFSPHLKSENHPSRKPEIGMALQAKADFPLIDFEKSIMLGDTQSDMDFGKKAGMKTIQIGQSEGNLSNADGRFDSLFEFTRHFLSK